MNPGSLGVLTAAACLALAWPAAAQSGFPFQDESLRYGVSWQSGLSLGEAAMNARHAGKGWEFTVSVNAVVPGFSLNDSFRALADAGLCSTELDRTTDHRGKSGSERTTFDQAAGSARRLTLFPAAGGESTFSIPSCARDAVAYIYYARVELGQGRVPPAQQVYFGSAYNVRLTYVGDETLKVADKPTLTDHLAASVKGPKADFTLDIFYARDPARTPLAVRIPAPVGVLSLELAR
jgi:hypothetical protein